MKKISKRAVKRSFPKSMQEALDEAKRYFKNAKETLKKSPIEFGVYTKPKHVKEASAMGYLATLRAIDSYLLARGIKSEELPASIEEYKKYIQQCWNEAEKVARSCGVTSNDGVAHFFNKICRPYAYWIKDRVGK